jgi:hypothetical protein
LLIIGSSETIPIHGEEMPETIRPNHIPSAIPFRKDDEFPAATAREGWRYHHLGIPTKIPRQGEKHLPAFGLYVSGFETSACGIEWMRFEEGSPVSELIQTVPHIAFVVDDLEAAIEGKEILTGINSPSEGVRVAMIIESGAPIELMEFSRRTA